MSYVKGDTPGYAHMMISSSYRSEPKKNFEGLETVARIYLWSSKSDSSVLIVIA